MIDETRDHLSGTTGHSDRLPGTSQCEDFPGQGGSDGRYYESFGVTLDPTVTGAVATASRRFIWIVTYCKYQDRMFLLHPPDIWYHTMPSNSNEAWR